MLRDPSIWLATVQKLTDREQEILALIGLGLMTKEISHRLGISPRTVDTYRTRIALKTNTHALAGLIRLAISSSLD
jgi:DNA-binding CsgD family transcriptional regulator